VLIETGKHWRQEAQKLLADMGPMKILRLSRAEVNGAAARALADRRLDGSCPPGAAISSGLMTNSYRDSTEAWKAEEETEARSTDILPPSIGRGQSRKPYFEVLMVSPAERSMWPEIRRPYDDCAVSRTRSSTNQSSSAASRTLSSQPCSTTTCRQS